MKVVHNSREMTIFLLRSMTRPTLYRRGCQCQCPETDNHAIQISVTIIMKVGAAKRERITF